MLMAKALSPILTSTKIAGGIPLAILALFYAWAASVRLMMGGFPEPSTLPEPLSTLSAVVGLVLVFTFPLTAVSLFLATVSFFPRLQRLRSPSLAFACSGAFVIAVLTIDPLDVIRWFMD